MTNVSNPGKIIIINGPSSSGKTTLALALQNALDKPYLILSLDEYSDLFTGYMAAYQKIGRSIFPRRNAAVKFPQEAISIPEPGMALTYQMLAGFHQSIAAKANAGQRMIVDHVFEQRRWLEECVTLFEGIAVIFVSVHCSLEELERRERRRGDRNIGLARHQYKKVHAHEIYDVEVDTTNLSPAAWAAKIIAYLKSGEPPLAFEKLRQEIGSDAGTKN